MEKIISQSSNYIDDKLSKERREVMEFYRGEKPKQIHAGSSKYVSLDVYDAVDSMRSQLMETFSAHQRIVQFTPQNAEDVQAAHEATEYCPFVFFRQNDGDAIMYDVITDGLMARYGVVKVHVEEDEEAEDIEGLTEDDLDSIAATDDRELSNVTAELVPGQDGMFSPIFNATLKKKKKRICLVPLAPEEFLIMGNSKDIKSATAATHRTVKTKKELIEEGYDPKLIEDASNTESTLDTESDERFSPVNAWSQLRDDALEEGEEPLWCYESYVKTTIDGEYRLWKIVMVGRTVLEVSKVRCKPFAAFIPLPVPHTWFGDNYAKNVIPTQRARTALIRSIIDHTMITNNPRLMVLNGSVPNPNELMDNRLGGLVNVRRLDGVAPLPQAALNPFAFETIKLLDDDKEESTGISRLSQGLNKDALSKQNAQATIEQLISVSQIRQKIVARQFGKFMKELFLLIHDTALENIDQQEIATVTGTVIQVNTETWLERKDATVELALGYGEAEREANKFIEIYSLLSQDHSLQTQFGPAQKYELIKRALRKKQIVDVESIVLPPEKAQPPEPNPMEQAELALKQSNARMLDAQSQATVMKAQAELLRAKTEAMIAQSKIKLGNQDHALDVAKFAHDVEVDQWEAEQADKAADQKAIYAVNGNS